VLSRSYYLSEGTTAWSFATTVVVTNPNQQAAAVTVTFLKPAGTIVTTGFSVPAQSQYRLNPASVAGMSSTDFATVVTSADGLPLLVERSMTWDGQAYGSHAEAAVDSLSTTWHFSEGLQGNRFQGYLLVGNPGAEAADITVTFLFEDRAPVSRTYRAAATSRFTVPLGTIAELDGRPFGLSVVSSRPISAERALYFSTASRFWDGGHVSSGTRSASATWLFSEGATHRYFDTYLLLLNPGHEAATVTLTYRPNGGTPIVRTHTVPGERRVTLDVSSESGELADADFWIDVTSSHPIVAERAMYWPHGPDAWTDGHASAGSVSGATNWAFADGMVGGPNSAQTYLLLANPSDTDAQVRVSMVYEDGEATVTTRSISAGARETVWVNGVAGIIAGRHFWMRVDSTNGVPVVAERSTYSDAAGEPWTAGSSLVGTPLTVGATPSAPVATVSASSRTYMEGTGPLTLDPGLTVSDADSVVLAGATVSIATGFRSGEDLLALPGIPGIAATYNASTGVLTMSGNASVAAYQAALRAVTYASSRLPASPSARRVTFSVTDGVLTSAPSSLDLTIQAQVGPSITAPATFTTRLSDLPATIPLTLADPDTPLGQLTITWRSSNHELLGDNEGTVVGSGADRQLSLRTLMRRYGSTNVAITVSDGLHEASTVVAVTIVPGRFYYLAEGTTQWQFKTEVVITNPNEVAAPVAVTFLKPNGAIVVRDFTVPALTQHVIEAATVPGLESTDFSTVIESVNELALLIERKMTWDGLAYGAHAEGAVTGAARQWYFAEGVEARGFETFILVANPGAAQAAVTVTFLPDDGAPVSRTYSVGPTSRFTLAARQVPGVVGKSFGLRIDSTQPVAVERATYFTANGRLFEGGHVSSGVTGPARTWQFSEGATANFFDTYLVLANPGEVSSTVSVTYRTHTGVVVTRSHVVPAGARKTIDIVLEDQQLVNAHFWIDVRATEPVVAERPMYWAWKGQWREGHVSAGMERAATVWGFADGSAGGPGGGQTFLLLANPGEQDSEVEVTLTAENGATVVRNYTVGAGLRQTVWISGLIAEVDGRRFWARVASRNGVPILAERSMYWDAVGQVWAAGTTVAGTPLR
jgi:hypothetical protein